MAAEQGGFDEGKYITEQFKKQIKDLPKLQKYRAELGFAFDKVWNSKFFEKLKNSNLGNKILPARKVVNDVPFDRAVQTSHNDLARIRDNERRTLPS